MNSMIKHLAKRALDKLAHRKSLLETPVMQIPAPVLVQMAGAIESLENHIITLSLESSEMRMRAHLAERRVEALVKLMKHYNVPADEIEEQLESAK